MNASAVFALVLHQHAIRRASVLRTAIVALLISALPVFADGWGEIRNDEGMCGSNKKYTAYAQVKCNFLQGWVTASQGVCYPYCAERYVDKRNLSNTILVWQRTKYGPFCGFSSEGEVKRKRCYRGCSSFDLVNHRNIFMVPDGEDEGPPASESHTITASDISINNTTRQVTISGINGYERINTADFYGKFTVIIWLTDNATDDVITASKIQWQGSVMLENGTITYQNFTPGEVSLATTDSGHVMLFNNVTKVATLNASVDMSRIAVRLISHAEESVSGPIHETLSSTEDAIAKQNIIFSINPNPSSDKVALRFFSGDVHGVLRYKVFDATGMEIVPMATSFGNATEISSVVDISGLANGTYYLSVFDNIHNYMLPFVKE